MKDMISNRIIDFTQRLVRKKLVDNMAAKEIESRILGKFHQRFAMSVMKFEKEMIKDIKAIVREEIDGH